MRRIALVSCMLVGLAHAPRLAAQSSAGAANAPTANPKDVGSADAIISALYDANTIMVDQKKDLDRFRSLFVADAHLIPTTGSPTSHAALRMQTVEDYIRGAAAGPPRGGFSEREIARTSESLGPIMQVFSTYETHRTSADTNPLHGINSIQLFNDGSRWWVVNVFWANERGDVKIPEIYLKRSGKTP
jgi:hypothetical protein